MKINSQDNLYIASEPFSYKNIKNDLLRFRTNRDDLDTPGHLFFKVFFHFWNGDAYGGMVDGRSLESGLLAPTWDWGKDLSDPVSQRSRMMQDYDTHMNKQNAGKNDISETSDMIDMSKHNSAYNFLIRNDELERAEKLKRFIMMLSNISTNCPWYFQEITGLEELLSRSYGKGEQFKVEEQRKQLTIKCLPDSQDDRISTMLDLYRDVAFSNIWYREVLPANLRKFDMSIYIFSSPVTNIHPDDVDIHHSNASMDINASYKCIELHDCEFDYNYKGYYSSVNNTEGFTPTIEIPIYVGEANEIRYNAYIDRLIGDIVKTDLFQTTYTNGKLNQIYTSEPQSNTSKAAYINNKLNEIENIEKEKPSLGLLQGYSGSGGGIDLTSMVNTLTGSTATNFIKGQLLGNIHEYGLNNMTTGLSGLANSISSGSIGGFKNAIGNISEVKNGWYMKK